MSGIKKVLITGATGFVGGRLAEVLAVNSDVRVRVLVRNFATASRLACLDVEMVRGDVASLEDVMLAAESCDVVFNLAKGDGSGGSEKAVNIQGARNVIEAASCQGVRRVVHVSTAAVYGKVTGGEINEDYPCRPPRGDTYGRTKLKGEREALRLGVDKGVEVVVIQPTVVYGPRSAPYTITPLHLMSRGMLLICRGGICNAVYIDDVVQALLLAARCRDAAGERFIISGEPPVTWKEFFAAYERMLDQSRVIEKEYDECRRMRHTLLKDLRSSYYQSVNILRENPGAVLAILEVPEVRSLLRRFVLPLVGTVPPRLKRLLFTRGKDRAFNMGASAFQGRVYLASLDEIQFYAARAVFQIDKAKRILGYQPGYNLAQGMGITEKWARWANLI